MSESNTALFEKWRAGVPRVLELRLDDKTSNLELKVLDGEGVAIATLVYGLTDITPPDFDLALLRVAWDEWREGAR